MYPWMNRTAFSSLIPALFPFPVPGPVDRMIETALGFRQIGSAYEELRQTSTDRPISEGLLRKFEINTLVAQQDLSRIPSTGPVLIVVNHPFGILDGAVLAAVLASIRGDVKILANELLASIPEIRDLLIPVDTLGGKSAARRNSSSIKASIDFLAAGGLLVAFPAGEVSHFQWRKRSVTDSAWNPAIAAILRMAHRRGAECLGRAGVRRRIEQSALPSGRLVASTPSDVAFGPGIIEQTRPDGRVANRQPDIRREDFRAAHR